MINIFFLLSLILEGIISLYTPFVIQHLNVFYPHFVIMFLPILYGAYKRKNRFYIPLGICGFFYDLIYTDTIFLHIFLFLFLGWMISFFDKKIGIQEKNYILFLVLLLLLYDLLYVSLLTLFQNIEVSIGMILYKFTHSLLLNIPYGYFFYKLFPISKKRRIKKR